MHGHVAEVIVSVIDPIRHEHGKNAAECRDEHGTRNCYVDAARCRVFKVLENRAQRLQSRHYLLCMGFTTDFGSALPSSLSVGHDKVIEGDG